MPMFQDPSKEAKSWPTSSDHDQRVWYTGLTAKACRPSCSMAATWAVWPLYSLDSTGPHAALEKKAKACDMPCFSRCEEGFGPALGFRAAFWVVRDDVHLRSEVFGWFAPLGGKPGDRWPRKISPSIGFICRPIDVLMYPYYLVHCWSWKFFFQPPTPEEVLHSMFGVGFDLKGAHYPAFGSMWLTLFRSWVFIDQPWWHNQLHSEIWFKGTSTGNPSVWRWKPRFPSEFCFNQFWDTYQLP